MNKTKKYITIAAVLLCVCAAVYLNWSYNNDKTGGSSLSDAELANTNSDDETVTGLSEDVSSYFASARLTRQQSRDEALDLLKSAATSQNASQETIDGAMNAISAMANYSMQETQIENLLLAKSFADCVAFISADGVTLAVPAPAEGLAAEDVAKITDAVVAETDFAATQIRVIEVKSKMPAPSPAVSASPAVSPSPAANSTSENTASDAESAQTDDSSANTGEILE